MVYELFIVPLIFSPKIDLFVGWFICWKLKSPHLHTSIMHVSQLKFKYMCNSDG